MWPFIARPLDRFAIYTARGSVMPSPDGDSHVAEACALLKRPDFFSPNVPAAVLKFTGKDSFQFRSPVRSDCPANNLVHGRCELAGEDWQRRPTVILLHGWNAELQYQWCLPYWSQLLARSGVNAFRFELPYHASRRPRQVGVIQNFLSGNLLHVARATHQALADARALALWLQDRGAPVIGLWGTSLGAWLAGLAAAHQSEINFAVMLTPVVRMERALQELAFCEPIRDQLRDAREHFACFNLVAHALPSERKNVLIVASEYDLFAPAETIDELERAWRPELWRVPHGHISVLLSSPVMRRITRWVSRAVESPAPSPSRSTQSSRASSGESMGRVNAPMITPK
jgi:dienelactone hydrolase